MSTNIADNNLVADAKAALKFWEEHPEINLNEMTCAQFKKAQATFQKITDDLAQQEIEMNGKSTERDQLGKTLRLAISRLRSGARAFFGPDSKEYEQIGGTRVSTRKRPARRGNIEAVGAADGHSNGNGNGQSEGQLT